MGPIEMLIDDYKTAAGEAASAEIKLRLLADKYPATQRLAHAQKLEQLEGKIVQYYRDSTSQDEVSLLQLSGRLRNELFHADFRKASELLYELGRGLSLGGVARISTEGLSDKERADQLASAASSIV